MKHIAIINILILIISVNANSQDLDSNLISDCRLLHDKGLLEEARNCYMQHDTSIYAIYGAAVISKQLQDSKSLKKLSKRLVSKKHRSPISYKLCADLYTDDSIKCIGIIKKGLKIFEDDSHLLLYQTNYYLTNKDFTSAISSIDELIKYNKVDIKSLFFAKGNVYQMIKDNKNALINYEKAINIDPEYFIVYFNIATIYYNQAVVLYDQADNERSDSEYLKLKTKAEKELAKAIPYLTKAAEIKPDDLMVLNTLKTIYYKLNKNEEFELIKKRIDKLNGE